MPVCYEFSGNILRMNLKGSYKPQDIIDTFNEALCDPSFPEDSRFLLDVRKSLELANRSSAVVKMVAEYFAEHSEQFGRRCAVVASEPVHYGLCRLGAKYAEFLGAEIRVFTNLPEAVNWLNTISVP